MYDYIIKDIRQRCRMAMNGITSSGMRAYGLDYKLNFGVPIQQIKEISTRYRQDAILAEKLWKDNTRELKILATMLYPLKSFSKETARRWVTEIPNQEIREQYTFNLLRHSTYILDIGLEFASDVSADMRISGYWFLSRYFIQNKGQNENCLKRLTHVWEDLVSENYLLSNSVRLFLKDLGKSSRRVADSIINKVISYKDSEILMEREVYHSLAFEFDFFYGGYFLTE